MIKLKQLIKYDNANVLEATWVDIQTETYESPIFEKNKEGIEVDTGKTETKIREIETVVKCHAYADVQMDLLKADALEMNTPLDEYNDLIAEVQANIVLPTQDELNAEIVQSKIQEYRAYLASTDFKMTVDYYATLSVDEQTALTAKRAEARDYLKAQGL